jgi:hypothetical protein
MAESFKDKVAVLPSGAQRAFIEESEKSLSIARMAHACGCSERTVRDWRREKFPMQYHALQKICALRKIPIPKRVTTRSRYAHTRAAGLLGAQVTMRKYGRVPVDEALRKERWHAWWQDTGAATSAFGTFARSKPIRKPRKSAALAEFMGIMMGDGGMHPYQATITLHYIDDRAYAAFVARLAETLFGTKPGIYHLPRKSVRTIVLSRVEAVAYLHELGLPIGNKVKQEFDIPTWIKTNRSFSIACLRGLIDTDGTVFTHAYRVNGKRYAYKKLSFCSHSRPLLLSTAKIFADLGMHPRVTTYDVWLDRARDVQRYFSLVKPHNQKHLKRYLK